MELSRKTIKRIIFIIFICSVIFLLLQNLNIVFDFLKWCFQIISPFLLGICIAFILNVLMRFIEEKLCAPLNRRYGRVWNKLRRPLCVVLTYGIVIGLVCVLLFLIFPQLSRSFYTLLKNIPNYAKDLQLWAEDVLTSLQISPDVLHNFELDWKKITDVAEGWIQKLSPDVLGSMVQFTSALAGGIFNFVLGVAFSVYMLLKKETLCRQTKRLLFAFISKDKAEYLVSIARLSSAVFSRFVSGQLLEAFIIGFLCFLGMCAFSMPYALLISVIIGVTALVPIFGAFFGTALGAFILLMVHPMTAFWFVVFILILQQIESNVIYPRVQGKFVGLPGMWVLFAVTVGGGVFGVAGMLIGVPLASVLYCLLREAVAVRLQAKRRLKEENAVVEHKDAAPGASNETEETNTDDDNQANEENGEKE